MFVLIILHYEMEQRNDILFCKFVAGGCGYKKIDLIFILEKYDLLTKESADKFSTVNNIKHVSHET